MFSLPWQMYVLLFEVLASLTIVSLWLDREATVTYTWRRAVSYNFWDISCLGLLLWGGSVSWQHFLLGFMYLWAIWSAARKALRKRTFHLATPGPGTKTVAYVMGVLIALFQAYLIIGGVR